MSSVFEIYEEELLIIQKQLDGKISELNTFNLRNEKSDSLIHQLDDFFSQTNDLIKQMELEGRSQDINMKKILTEKLLIYKKNLINQKSNYERAKEKAQRSSLLGSKSIEQRQQMMDTNDKYN